MSQDTCVNDCNVWQSIKTRPIGDTGYLVTSSGQVIGPRGILKPWVGSRSGHLRVDLPGRRAYVHHLVMEAFVGPRPDGIETRHLNGDPADNRLSNLVYGTKAENTKDSVRHGTYRNGNMLKTHCIRGHEFNGENTYIAPKGYRRCRACRKVAGY